MQPDFLKSPDGVTTIDSGYLERPRFAASYLLNAGGKGVFIDNNTSHSVPRLLEAARSEGIAPGDVACVIITHVHLDHAGGSHALMKACPNAVLLAHPRAARHVIDPSKLVASAEHVYGRERFREMYGEILPVDAARVREMGDGEEFRVGDRTLRFLHTRGHANHHFCILDSGDGGSGAVFTGDAFGLAYPRLQGKGLFIFPSTSPTDFDPVEARASIDRILASGARRAYLTHFGAVDRMQEAADQLRRHLDFSERLLERAISREDSGESLTRFCRERLNEFFAGELERRGLAADQETWEFVEMDLDLNAQGIAYQAQKRRAGVGS